MAMLMDEMKGSTFTTWAATTISLGAILDVGRLCETILRPRGVHECPNATGLFDHWSAYQHEGDATRQTSSKFDSSMKE